MLDTLKIYNEFKEKLDPDVALKLAETFGAIYGELSNMVSSSDFNELKEIVRDLGNAQKQTEKRLDLLTVKVGELAEAQKRTEKKVEELAEAQKRTEEQVKALAEAQRKTEKRVDNLEKLVGGISNTLGYSLENKSYGPLKRILEERFGLKVKRLYRRNLVYASGKFDEINIYGEGRRDGKEIVVIGESKSQFGPKDVLRFLKQLERVKAYLEVDVFPLALAHQFHPKAEEKLTQLHIPFFWSYETDGNS